MIRSGSDETVAELAAVAEVPVINGLTPRHHPRQVLADLLTLHEHFGGLEGFGSPISATATTSPARWRSSGGWPGSRW